MDKSGDLDKKLLITEVPSAENAVEDDDSDFDSNLSEEENDQCKHR